MVNYNRELILTNEAIESLIGEVFGAYAESAGDGAMAETKFRLSFEEILLQFRECYGEDAPCKITVNRQWGKNIIELSTRGERREWPPVEEDMKPSYDILARLGASPRYVYSFLGKGRNRVIWEPIPAKAKHSSLIKMLIAVALAVLSGIIINALPQSVHDLIANDLLAPFFNKFIAILSALATPLVFLAVICGIVGIGDVGTFGKIGSRVLKRMGLSYIISALIVGAGCAVSYGLTLGGAEAEAGGSAWGQVVQLVLDIVPDNLFLPFTQGNDLQVIVISIFVGVALLILGNRASKLCDVIKEASDLINQMMLICTKLLPFIVYFGVTKIICESQAEQFISIGKMMLVFLCLNAVFFAILIVRVQLVTKTSFRKIFPKQVATLMINLATSSQVAALPENMKCCKEKFGIDTKLVDFALPLGIVVYMPSGAIFLGVTAWALSVAFGVTVTLSLMIRIMFVCVVVAIAAPPIPGSALVVIPILLSTCGVPGEAFPLAIIFGTIAGYLCPAFNGFNLQIELLMTAKKLGKVNEEALKNAYVEETV